MERKNSEIGPFEYAKRKADEAWENAMEEYEIWKKYNPEKLRESEGIVRTRIQKENNYSWTNFLLPMLLGLAVDNIFDYIIHRRSKS